MAILKSPPLTEWTSLKPIYEYQQALKALGGDVRLRWDEVPKVEDPYGDQIIDREQLGQLRAAELAQLEICRATSKAVADSLTSFRAQGRNNPPRKRTWNLRLSGRSNSA